ncbi:MAG: glycosyl transferase, group 1, partial [Bryobacterales bacterium]|nr:glycosyl transferase, group 1 [Bryobacterales bacterium]
LEVFDHVRIVARANESQRVPDDWVQVNDKHVVLHAIPDFHGPWQCLKRYAQIRAALRSGQPAHGAIILRVASQLANMMEGALSERSRPFGLEVVGDPYDVFGPGVIGHPLRPLLRWHFSRRLRQQCLAAAGVAYVTKLSLQKRYPTQGMNVSVSDVDLAPGTIINRKLATHYSSVDLDRDSAFSAPRQPQPKESFRLVTVGSLEQRYKGTDILIDAIAQCVKAGFDLTAVIVGDGRYRPDLMAQAERAGIASRIQFPGWVPAGKAVRDILDQADLFVLPSRTEGLPRALIEAMARGLPCLGTAVGGIPELLEGDSLVAPNDASALANSIQRVLSNPSAMGTMSRRNTVVASEYSSDVLKERRHEFYLHLRACAEAWDLARRT